MRDRFVVGYYGNPIHEVIAENEADRKQIDQWLDEGKISLTGRDEYAGPPRYHVKIDKKKWRWLAEQDVADAGVEELRALTAKDAVRRAALPALHCLPMFYGRIIGQDGLEEIAAQARLLLGDDDLILKMGHKAQALFHRLATLDLPFELWDEADKMAPGWGPKHGRRVYHY